jgi:hypothetical protein
METLKITKTKIAFLILLGLFIPGLVIWKNIFPNFEYVFGEANENKIEIFDKTINGKRYLVLPTDENYFFNKVVLDVSFKNNGLKKGETIDISIAKDYESVLYKLEGKIEDKEKLKEQLFLNNSSDFPNGTLFSYGESVYFISQENYLPILDARVFENLGFYWENVKSLNMDDVKTLSKGDKINYITPHPLGTILKTKKDYFLVGDKERFSIEEGALWEVWPGFNWVDIDGGSVEFFDECSVEIEKNNKIRCEFEVDKIRRGNNYIFQLDDDLTSDISKAKVKLKVSRDWKNVRAQIRVFLGDVKIRLSERYSKYF